MISDIILSVSKLNNSDLNDLYNTEISKFLIEPIISKVTDKTLNYKVVFQLKIFTN